MSNAMVITKDNFNSEVLQSETPVLVDFWAEWCGPCRMIGPIIDQLAVEYEGKLKVGKLNVDENSDIATGYKVMSIPTLIVFKGGEAVEKMVGAQPKASLKGVIDKHV